MRFVLYFDISAAKAASIHDFIAELPKGYDTPIGELGDRLSGGEKQRIGLARAFLSGANIMLLDEPTSNLGRHIEVQRLKSQKILNDEFCEQKLRRDVNSYLKKQRQKAERKLTKLKDNTACKDTQEREVYIPTCDLSSVLYIYKGQIQCKRYHHEIISATAKLFGRRDNEIILNVEYCTECKKYLLEYTVYEEYRKRYGVIIGNLKMDSHGALNGYYDLATESPLRLTGYSVGQKEGYSSKERQYILAQIIHNHIMTKQEIIKYLSYFIKMNGSRLGNEYAVSKWQEDMQFVQNYNINYQPSTIIKEIKQY